MKIYGPYTRKDNRQHICIVHEDGSRQTQSFPRFLMEQHLGRKLQPHEEVDHIDNNFTNNDITNLQVLTKTQNRRKEMQRDKRKASYVSFVCPCCGNTATKRKCDVDHNRKKGRAGPYCSRQCAGKMHN